MEAASCPVTSRGCSAARLVAEIERSGLIPVPVDARNCSGEEKIG